MARVTHFDISAADVSRARAFYEATFGWRFQKWDGPMDYWLISTGDGEGINGGMGEGPDGPAVTNIIDVVDIDAAAQRIVAHGGTIVAPKMTIPGVGWMVTFKDTEGNTFGAMQADERAG